MARNVKQEAIKRLEQRIEQRSRIENGVIIEYDADYSTIDTYHENYIKHLRNKGNKIQKDLEKIV